MVYRLHSNTTAAPATVDFSHLSGMDRNLNTESFAREAAMPAARWREILRSYPPEAQAIYKDYASRAEAAEAFSATAFQQKQDLRARHRNLNADVRALNRQLDNSEPEFHCDLKAQIADARDEIEEIGQKISAIDFDLSMRSPSFDPEKLKSAMARSASRVAHYKTYEANLQKQSPAKDERKLAEIREQGDAIEKEIQSLDLAALPEEVALEAAFAQIDKITKTSSPDFSPLTRMTKNGFTAERTQGKIKWPQKHVRGDQFEDDPFRLLFWLFSDTIKERAAAEIKKLQRPGALGIAERAEKKAKLENNRFELWRVEHALVERLRASGRSDVEHRRETPIAVLLRLTFA